MGVFNQFSLLIWKNFVLQKRRPIATVFELILPMLFSLLLVIIRDNVAVTNHKQMTNYSEFSVSDLPNFKQKVIPAGGVWTIAYVPDDVQWVTNVMKKVETELNTNSKLEAANQCGLGFLDYIDPNQDFKETFLSNDYVNYMDKNFDDLISQNNETIECILARLPSQDAEKLRDMLNNKTMVKTKQIQQLYNFIETAGTKVKLMPFSTEDSFLSFVKNDSNLKEVLAGAIFQGRFDNKSLPSNLDLVLRFHADPINSDDAGASAFTGITNTWKTHSLYPLFQLPGPRETSKYGGAPGYYKEGFLTLQHAIYIAIGSEFSKHEFKTPTFAMKRYPYPPYLEDDFIVAIQRTLPLLIMLSYFYTALVIVRSIVQEKESKMKEYMMMMGLSNWLHWLAWFLKYLVFLCISCIFMAGFYKIPTRHGSVLTKTDATLVFVFLILFAAATINLCFLISVFFSKANVGAAAGGVLYGLTYMPYLFMQNNYDQLSHLVKVISCLFSNVAMANGCQLIGMFEGKGTGLQWSSIHKGVTVDDNFTMVEVFLMLLLDAVLYMLLAVYIEGVWPGDYGIPKPWYFPFMPSYWTGRVAKKKGKSATSIDIEGNENGCFQNGCINTGQHNDYFEEEPTQLSRIVEIKNLTKVFKSNGKEKVAVSNLTFNMYEGQINVLLGHNGAGKTTTMSMLTGFFPPSSGEAYVMDHSITTDMGGVRKSLGYCPQFNILFDLLTVDEHLYFFARLKGCTSKEAKECSESTVSMLKLEDKWHVQSKKLSGGMKRKLSVGIALTADPKYVILDEPTSGMDPSARRAIWEVIQEYRRKCSMLISTHFMDEADLLGDRIAIMADGKLRCAGSSVFLKGKFGVGYHVVLTKSNNCDISKLNDFFKHHVPECFLERTAGAEVSFLLPVNSTSYFPKLFRNLEESANELGVVNFGASVTTMEEVFLRVTQDAESELETVNRRMSTSRSEQVRQSSMVEEEENEETQYTPLQGPNRSYLHSSLQYNTGIRLWLQQFYGLFIKRVLHSKRNFKVAIAQLLVPVVFGIIAIINAKFPPFEQDNTPLNLTLDAYGENFVYFTKSPDGRFVDSMSYSYTQQFGSLETVSEVTDGSLQQWLSDRYEMEGGDFNSDNLISASFHSDPKTNTSKNVAWFNDQAYHTPASSLAYMDQAYIRLVTKQPNFTMKLINDPLPRNSTNRIEEQLIGSLSGFLIAFNIVLGFSFLAASFCLFLVRERVDRSSLLQTLAGVDPFCFWFSAFLWDFINFMIPCILTMVMFFALSVKEFSAHSGICLLIFALYCWASLPLMYCLSFLFTVPSTGLVRITILNIITGLASIITINILRLLNLGHAADILDWVFLFMPQYCLGQGLADLYANDKMVNICTQNPVYEYICHLENITYQTDFLAWEQYGVGRFVAFLAAQGLLFFIILYIIEFNLFPTNFCMDLLRTLYCCKNKQGNGGPAWESLVEDEDVVVERNRINSTLMPQLVTTDRLILQNLTKIYDRNLVAVDGLCLGIPEAECFGLLGINGAGKTTTFKMLTGDYKSTSGTAYLDGYDIQKDLRKVQQRMGYCPQFDGLIEQMTGAETLRMFARLRGVPEIDIPACVESLGGILHFEQYLDKTCGTYSGGNKRKLSTAIALVGNPPVVLLDEPSTGMDPGARRMLWDALADVRASGCSIVITSHSMEECEALCTRIAIMVNGQLRCLGGPQHLKNRFSQGYTIEIKMASTAGDSSTAKHLMDTKFPGCTLKDEHPGLLTYHVPQCLSGKIQLKLSEVFKVMESIKQQLNLYDYTVSQTTLEQVFLSLVRWQREATDHHESHA
uniref:ATP-binding cassette sub-family A member 3-like n=1 Tax=Phallusia mammillata TaxID=59560 RepID=A0A6F9D5N1_9ASCI|nr:ATP-binding cassette sub-family A member 3-like [Phallusia mammillata]